MPGNVYISYWGQVRDICAGHPIKSEVLPITTTSAAIAGTVPMETKVVTVFADTNAYVTIATGTPTAAVGKGSFFVPANTQRDLSIHQSGSIDTTPRKIAAVSLT